MYENPKDKADVLRETLISEMSTEDMLIDNLILGLFDPSISSDEYQTMIDEVDKFMSKKNLERQGAMAREYYESMLLTRFSEEFTDSVIAYLDKLQSKVTSRHGREYRLFSDLIDGCLEKNWTEQEISAFMAENPVE